MPEELPLPEELPPAKYTGHDFFASPLQGENAGAPIHGVETPCFMPLLLRSSRIAAQMTLI
ncbi:MAG: hypothetical protein AAB110_06000 [Candidatus Desantisbacteria bacterium]